MQRESYSGHTFDVDVYGERKRNPYEGVALQTITEGERRAMFDPTPTPDEEWEARAAMGTRPCNCEPGRFCSWCASAKGLED